MDEEDEDEEDVDEEDEDEEDVDEEDAPWTHYVSRSHQTGLKSLRPIRATGRCVMYALVHNYVM